MRDDVVSFYGHTIERLRARAKLFKESARDVEERAVGRALDEVADAMEETLDRKATYED